MDKKLTFGQRVKEAFRKFLVALKRKPNIIPLVNWGLEHFNDVTDGKVIV